MVFVSYYIHDTDFTKSVFIRSGWVISISIALSNYRYFSVFTSKFGQFWAQNEPIELIMPDIKRSVGMFQILFGVNMSIFKGAMAPESEVTFFWQAPPFLL